MTTLTHNLPSWQLWHQSHQDNYSAGIVTDAVFPRLQCAIDHLLVRDHKARMLIDHELSRLCDLYPCGADFDGMYQIAESLGLDTRCPETMEELYRFREDMGIAFAEADERLGCSWLDAADEETADQEAYRLQQRAEDIRDYVLSKINI